MRAEIFHPGMVYSRLITFLQTLVTPDIQLLQMESLVPLGIPFIIMLLSKEVLGDMRARMQSPELFKEGCSSWRRDLFIL